MKIATNPLGSRNDNTYNILTEKSLNLGITIGVKLSNKLKKLRMLLLSAPVLADYMRQKSL